MFATNRERQVAFKRNIRDAGLEARWMHWLKKSIRSKTI